MLKLAINGKRYSGWQSVQLSHSLAQLPALATLTIRHDPALAVAIPTAADAYELYYHDKLIQRGWLDGSEDRTTATASTLSLFGRSQSMLLADCALSVNIKKPTSLFAICRTLAERTGLELATIGADVGIAHDFAMQAERPYERLASLLREHGRMITSDGMGKLIVSDSLLGSSGALLQEGVNLKEYSIKRDHSARFASYKVVSVDALENAKSASASDSGAIAGKVLELMADQSYATIAECQSRADFEASSRAAASEILQVQVGGWGPDNTNIYQPGYSVDVRIPSKLIDGSYLITKVQLQLDDKGSSAALELSSPSAYGLGS